MRLIQEVAVLAVRWIDVLSCRVLRRTATLYFFKSDGFVRFFTVFNILLQAEDRVHHLSLGERRIFVGLVAVNEESARFFVSSGALLRGALIIFLPLVL